MNTGESWPVDVTSAWHRVLAMQTKLHRWARADPGRRFDDLFNLVYDPAFLLAAWDRVRGNKGGRTAGVDGIVPRFVPAEDVTAMLTDLRHRAKTGGSRRCRYVSARSRKRTGRPVRFRIPTMTDRIFRRP